MRQFTAFCVAVLLAGPAMAEFAKVNDAETFRALINGKTLTRPLIRLTVSPSGKIDGTGASWEVEGEWRWQNGYFCRDLRWGGTDLGYNCQEVRVKGNKIRFTSDKGTGDFADFRIRSD